MIEGLRQVRVFLDRGAQPAQGVGGPCKLQQQHARVQIGVGGFRIGPDGCVVGGERAVVIVLLGPDQPDQIVHLGRWLPELHGQAGVRFRVGEPGAQIFDAGQIVARRAVVRAALDRVAEYAFGSRPVSCFLVTEAEQQAGGKIVRPAGQVLFEDASRLREFLLAIKRDCGVWLGAGEGCQRQHQNRNQN